MIIRRMTVVAMLSLVAFVAIAQDRDVPAALRPYMTGEEFRAAGLHKLNPVELAQFQAWFVRTIRDQPPAAVVPTPAERALPEPTAPVADRDDPRLFGLEGMSGRDTELVANARGTFEGWERGTVFELDNGQTWEVYDTARFRFLEPLENPTVTIERGAFNTYRLRVEGYNRTANVRRKR